MTPTEHCRGDDCPPAADLMRFAQQEASQIPREDDWDQSQAHISACPHCKPRFDALLSLHRVTTVSQPDPDQVASFKPMLFLHWQGILESKTPDSVVFEHTLTLNEPCESLPSELKYRLELHAQKKIWKSEPDVIEYRFYLVLKNKTPEEHAKLEQVAGRRMLLSLRSYRAEDNRYEEMGWSGVLQWTEDKSELSLGTRKMRKNQRAGILRFLKLTCDGLMEDLPESL